MHMYIYVCLYTKYYVRIFFERTPSSLSSTVPLGANLPHIQPPAPFRSQLCPPGFLGELLDG